MDISCTFVFHYNLNDFLPAGKKYKPISYTGKDSTSVKDAIEAIGIPHVEVKEIKANGNPVLFSYRLEPNDLIDVRPFETVAIKPSPIAFVLDVHLGKLARLLRLLGFDTHYETGYADAEIVALAAHQNRIALTRDVGLLKHKVLRYGYWLRSQNPEEQLAEVVKRFSLCDHIRPFSRCIACNGLIATVEKEKIQYKLPPNTRGHFHEFYQCSHCQKVYWKGSHYDKMVRRIAQFRSVACQVGAPAL
ncbi:hypothetical protein HRH25_16470 [Flavisolibacter sp. BT320]|nr:hypothetical protein [Flavisolibacter longurius]